MAEVVPVGFVEIGFPHEMFFPECFQIHVMLYQHSDDFYFLGIISYTLCKR